MQAEIEVLLHEVAYVGIFDPDLYNAIASYGTYLGGERYLLAVEDTLQFFEGIRLFTSLTGFSQVLYDLLQGDEFKATADVIVYPTHTKEGEARFKKLVWQQNGDLEVTP